MQEQHQSLKSLNFLLFTFCNNCLFVDLSKDEMFDFLTSNSCFFAFFLMRVPWQTRKYIRVPWWQKGWRALLWSHI